MKARQPTAIDLFSGAGGLSLGLQRAGFDVLLSSDNDSAAARTHERNLSGIRHWQGDIEKLTSRHVLRLTGLATGELDLLTGGPPCQGFSMIGARRVDDPRNGLFREFLRIASALRPKAILMENVPGLTTAVNGTVTEAILGEFSAAGYEARVAELLAAQYGVPQMRWRIVFVAFRPDLLVGPGLGFPAPTHGRRRIGELIPNCTVSPSDSEGFVTTDEAIGDLPPLMAGEEADRYTGHPTCLYQKLMRSGLESELFNHYAPRLAPQTLARIRALRPGQDWRDLPRVLLPGSMKRALRKDHTRRYSRMTWNGVPRAIITRFRDPKTGEYTHPEQDRTISIREAARIQSFPDWFAFEGTRGEQYVQVGNAVPPLLGQALASEIRACLEGNASFRLDDPFLRRPALRQAHLRFGTRAGTSAGHA